VRHPRALLQRKNQSFARIALYFLIEHDLRANAFG
jgi:hypothetical protein